jgi:hypothetical protein
MPPNNQFPFQPTAAPAPGMPVQPPVIPQVAPATPQQTTATQSTPPVKKNPNSTQNTLLLSEIRDNMVIMADGTFRAVVACKSINFDLMSSKEREGVEFSYQDFLNSLNYPIQIVVRSQRIDIGPYIDRLVEIRRQQDNMLLNVLMDDYINFVDVLSQEANIMDKSFFIAIPYYPQGEDSNLIEQGKGFFGKMFPKPKGAITKIDSVTYEKAKEEIGNRVAAVTSGLFQLGVQSVQLNTKELGELYYNVYNPDTAVREPLGNFENVTATYVRKAPVADAMAAELGTQR